MMMCLPVCPCAAYREKKKRSNPFVYIKVLYILFRVYRISVFVSILMRIHKRLMMNFLFHLSGSLSLTLCLSHTLHLSVFLLSTFKWPQNIFIGHTKALVHFRFCFVVNIVGCVFESMKGKHRGPLNHPNNNSYEAQTHRKTLNSIYNSPTSSKCIKFILFFFPLVLQLLNSHFI